MDDKSPTHAMIIMNIEHVIEIIFFILYSYVNLTTIIMFFITKTS